MEKLLNYIDGKWCESLSGQWVEHESPVTGLKDLELPRSNSEDIDRAVSSAKSAFTSWSQLTQIERSDYLYKIADLIDRNKEELARLESIDQGKPVALALKMDIARASQNFRYFAGHMLHRQEVALPIEAGILNYSQSYPVGVAGLISPWNLPLYLLTWKIAPALATGNTVVCKPSEFTSRTANYLTKLLDQAKLPKGVCNIIFGLGPEAGEALVNHRDVQLLSFTGGTKTGRHIAQASAGSFKKLSLELGGKNATVIFSDANLVQHMDTIVRSSFLNQGEICLCGSRILVSHDIVERFKVQFLEKVATLKVGNPEADVFMGPLVSRIHHEKVLSFIALAQKEAKILCGGGAPKGLSEFEKNGFFLEPTVISDVAENSRLLSEEIFGPVVTIQTFETEEEAIRLANSTEYGLSATLYTENLSRAHRVAQKIAAGTVWINTWLSRDLRMPFGGVKNSGIGREGAEHSVRFFTELKTICINIGKF